MSIDSDWIKEEQKALKEQTQRRKII